MTPAIPSSKNLLPVVMPNGDEYVIDIQPNGTHRNRRGIMHRVYRKMPGGGALRFVADSATAERVAARLKEMQKEAERDLRREKLFGKRLVNFWRWIMIFFSKVWGILRTKGKRK